MSETFLCSWSGGKDSALAYHRAVKMGLKPAGILTMMDETGKNSRSHGLSLEVLAAQAKALGVTFSHRATSWNAYEKNFREMLAAAAKAGIKKGVFGDIDIEDHRAWVERVCAAEGLQAVLPLWGIQREPLLAELLGAGFRAEIIAVQDGKLPPLLLGHPVDKERIDEFRLHKVDLAGEKGEYHTVVTAGPIFSAPVKVDHIGPVQHGGYWYSHVSLRPKG